MCIHELVFHDGVVWRLRGQLTADVTDLFVADAARIAAAGYRWIVLDLRDVSMIDAGGLGGIVMLYKAMLCRRLAVSIASAPKRVHHVLTLTRLTNVVPTFDSVEQACRHHRLSDCVVAQLGSPLEDGQSARSVATT
jgi:anti-anti-sigma factor